jgi:cobaltochelatase CobN
MKKWTVLWLNSLGGKGGASTPAISDDRVFVGSLTGDLYCLNSTTGKTLWNRTLDKNPGWWGVASSPLVQGETVYVMSFSDGAIHSLDLDGKEMWNMTTGRIHPFASAASSGRSLYFPGGDPALYCIDATSESWYGKPRKSLRSQPPSPLTIWHSLLLRKPLRP